MSKAQVVIIWITVIWVLCGLLGAIPYFSVAPVDRPLFLGFAIVGAVGGGLFYITFEWLRRRR